MTHGGLRARIGTVGLRLAPGTSPFWHIAAQPGGTKLGDFTV